MCGIGGILRRDGGKIDPAWLEVIDRGIAHRGPDGEGRFEDCIVIGAEGTGDGETPKRRNADSQTAGQSEAGERRPEDGRQKSAVSRSGGKRRKPNSRTAGQSAEDGGQRPEAGVDAPSPCPLPEGEDDPPTQGTRVVRVALVHRRLSIIDHDTGGQPMVSESGRDEREGLVAVVFNGCIYNHRELRAELEGRGHGFETDHSDTEVLIHGYREWKGELIDHLEGMYAFAIWDRTNAALALGRDWFGEKPLYVRYGVGGCGGVLAFSSCAGSLYALERYEPWAGAVNQWTERYLQLGWNWQGQTVYAGAKADSFEQSGAVRNLPPTIGRVLPELTAKKHKTSHDRQGVESDTSRDREGVEGANGDSGETAPLRSRLVKDKAPSAPSRSRLVKAESRLVNETVSFDTKDAARKGFDRLLRAAVERRLEADVPLGCFLSGGVDSSLIARFAKDAKPDLKTFTVRMPDARYDESHFAEDVAEQLGTDHATLEVEMDPAGDLVMLIRSLGQPFADSSILPTYWVSKSARRHVKVALSGDGGDELFLGYERYLAARRLFRHRRPLQWIPRRWLCSAHPKSIRHKVARLGEMARDLPAAGILAMESLFSQRQMREILGRRPTQCVEHLPGFDPMQSLRLCDLVNYLPDDLMCKVDTASMAVDVGGLEVRAPFLDRDLVRAALRAPTWQLAPGGKRKGLLREIAKGYLPADIVDRPKMGFAVPIGEWFREDYGGLGELLTSRLADLVGGAFGPVKLDRSAVARMLDDHMSGRCEHGQRLFALLTLAIWAREVWE